MARIGKERRDQQPARQLGGSRPFAALKLFGGRLCLDFVNSVDPRVGDQQQDYLTSYADLVQWSGYAHVLAQDKVVALLHSAAQHPHEAAAVFERAITLREALYRVFTAVASEVPPAPADLDAVQVAYVESLARSRLVPTAQGYAWRWPEGMQALEQIIWPIISSAVELLTSFESQRVKICPGLGDCGWLFLDTSKSGRRRWCSMESCGSRSKMRHYYARTRPQTQ
jgi:predicted RNA-binding Zn ribbon-like protein